MIYWVLIQSLSLFVVSRDLHIYGYFVSKLNHHSTTVSITMKSWIVTVFYAYMSKNIFFFFFFCNWVGSGYPRFYTIYVYFLCFLVCVCVCVFLSRSSLHVFLGKEENYILFEKRNSKKRSCDLHDYLFLTR